MVSVMQTRGEVSIRRPPLQICGPQKLCWFFSFGDDFNFEPRIDQWSAGGFE